MTNLAEALSSVLQRIRQAARRSGRDGSAVQLIAVSKTFDVQRIREVLDAGHCVFGENRVQEALDKMPELGDQAEWHLIGHLQRNKARHVVGRFARLHGVDNEALALELDRRAAAAGVRQPILLQVNVSGEASKSGIDPSELPRLLETVMSLPALDPRGLMTIPPPSELPEDNRVWFAGLRELRDRCAKRSGLTLAELSMGMSDDFEVAVEEGATWVRVGRAIFGDR